MVRAYWTIWTMIAVLASVVLVSGNMTMLIGVGFGFVVFGMIFSGMMMILPATVARRNHPDVPNVKTAKNENYFPTGAVHAR